MLSDDLSPDRNLTCAEALALVVCDLETLVRAAARRRDTAHDPIISYSRKVHSAHPALPGRLSLLHLCAAAAQA
jgi:hypothetical protein